MPVAVVSAAAPTTGTLPVSQTISTSVLNGETPVAVIIRLTRGTAVGTTVAGNMLAIGAWDGTTVRSAVSMSEDGATIAVSEGAGRRTSSTKIIQILATNGTTIDGEADPVSLQANGVTISWSNLPGTAVQLEVELIYGAGMQAYVGEYAGNTASVGSSTTITGIPFRPRLVHFFGTLDATGAGAVNNASLFVGFAALEENGMVQGQFCAFSAAAKDPTTSTAVGSEFRNDASVGALNMATGGGITVEAWHETTAGTADGFTQTTRNSTSLPISSFYVAMRNGLARAWTSSAAVGLNTTGTKTVTPSFPPGVIWCIPTIRPQADVNTGIANADMGMGIGCNGTDGSQKCASVSDEDAATTSDSYGVLGNNFNALNTSNNTDWIASISARSSTTFTFNVTKASASDKLVGFALLESVSATGSINQQRAALSGAAAEKFQASGSLTLTHATQSGAAAEKFQASGALLRPATVISGAAAERFSATGSILQPPTVLSGTAAERMSASGALLINNADLLGSAAERMSASGNLSAVAAILAGAAFERFQASGALLTNNADLLGAGTVVSSTIAGSGNITTAAALLSGAALERMAATGDLSARALLQGATLEKFTASGALTANNADLLGAAFEKFQASGTVLANNADLLGSAAERLQASGDLPVQSADLLGSASTAVIVLSQGGIVVRAVQIEGAALERFLATGQITVPATELEGSDADAIFDLVLLDAGRRLILDLAAGRKTVYDLESSF